MSLLCFFERNFPHYFRLTCRKCGETAWGDKAHVLRWAAAHAQREHGGAEAVVVDEWAFYQMVPAWGLKRR